MLFVLNKEDTKKVGFTATKKIGNAVKRNKAKRIMRALFIKYSKNLKDGIYIFVAKSDIVSLPFKNIEKDFYYTLSRANGFEK